MIYSDEELDEEENAATSNFLSSGRDSVIFAIDCSEAMFDVDGNDDELEASFNRIISAIHEMFLHKIISSDKDLHGIILFGTNKSNNSSDFPNIYEWVDFDVLGVDTIMKVRKMQKIKQKNFSDQFGFNPGHQMSDVLWACLNMFSKTSFKLANKELLIFAWNDQPHTGDKNAHKRAKAKAIDLHEHNVDVQVYSFNKDFHYDKFYKDIVSDPDSISNLPANPLDSIAHLYSYLLRKTTKQRPLARIPLQIVGGLEISVGVYTVARRATKTNISHLDSATNKPAVARTNYVDTNTAEILMPSDIKLQQTWAGKDISFEKEEIAAMKKIEKHGLTVLGFKPKSKAIKPWYHVKTAQFIYPDEDTIQGSTNLFRDLLTKCLEKDVVAICSFVPRANSAPRCVALLPQEEEVDPESSEQLKPPGFYIIFLPYADDIRHVEIDKNLPIANPEQVEAAEAMMRKLKFNYQPENFDNPVIQTHYKNLEAMALDNDEPEPIVDYTLPDNERISRKAGSLIQTFKSLVFSPDYKPNKATAKRKIPAKSEDIKQKKPKANMSEVDIQEHVSSKSLGKFTVAILKEMCQKIGIKPQGKKADIIKAISEHFQ